MTLTTGWIGIDVQRKTVPTQLALIDEIGRAEILLVSFVATRYLAVAAIPAALAYIVLTRVPAVYRKQTPGLSFLLLILFFAHLGVLRASLDPSEQIEGIPAAP